MNNILKQVIKMFKNHFNLFLNILRIFCNKIQIKISQIEEILKILILNKSLFKNMNIE